ncbi:MAG: hypothetical protein FD123_2726 [Bacteroidetes bacterium]|nr:MAG: hypothetical protein FD123_2726 [Bacteroidota bacterium]
MAKKEKKQVPKKKAPPLKKKKAPAPIKKAKPAVKSAPKKQKPAAKAKPQSKKAAKPSKANTKKPVKAKAPAAKPKKPAPVVKAPVKKQPVKPAKPEAVKTVTVQPVNKKKEVPVKTNNKAVVVPPVADPENEVIHIIKKGPPPPELKAQFNALKKKKLPPGEKRVVKTEVVNPHIIRDVAMTTEKTAKKAEPKGKFTLEFLFRAPVTLLYDFLTTPSGLVEWFAEEVDLKNDVYKFNWDGAIQYARIVSAKLDSHMRLKWLDKPDGTYLEFRIVPDEMTGQLALLVTDFGENEDDIVTLKQLWDSQITRLMKCLGSY